MTKKEVIALAVKAGITPWKKKEWSKDGFVHTDDGMDGDVVCLLQFAELIATAERNRICAVLDDLNNKEERHNYYGFIRNMIREMK